MKIDWNKKTNMPIWEFEESDYSNANQMREFISGHYTCRKCSTVNENKAWKILKGYYDSFRLAVEEIGKANAKSKMRRDLCDNNFSMLEGIDYAIDMPGKIIKQAEMMKELEEKKRKLEEEQNAEPEY